MNALAVIDKMRQQEKQHANAAFSVSLAKRDKAVFNMFYDMGMYDDARDALHELHIAQKRFEQEKR